MHSDVIAAWTEASETKACAVRRHDHGGGPLYPEAAREALYVDEGSVFMLVYACLQ